MGQDKVFCFRDDCGFPATFKIKIPSFDIQVEPIDQKPMHPSLETNPFVIEGKPVEYPACFNHTLHIENIVVFAETTNDLE